MFSLCLNKVYVCVHLLGLEVNSLKNCVRMCGTFPKTITLFMT